MDTELVTHKGFRQFGRKQGWTDNQINVAWRDLFYRLPFIRRNHKIEVVCLTCKRVMPCGDRPCTKAADKTGVRALILTRESLAALPEDGWGGVRSIYRKRLRAFVASLE